MKYIVQCVVDSTPGLYQFKTKKELVKFLKYFKKTYGFDGQEGDWIDFVIKGELIALDKQNGYRNTISERIWKE